MKNESNNEATNSEANMITYKEANSGSKRTFTITGCDINNMMTLTSDLGSVTRIAKATFEKRFEATEQGV